MTMLSVDGIGAVDLISRQAMQQELRHTPGAAAILPFVRLFCGCPSVFVWTADDGTGHLIQQAGGGASRATPFMPAPQPCGRCTRSLHPLLLSCTPEFGAWCDGAPAAATVDKLAEDKTGPRCLVALKQGQRVSSLTVELTCPHGPLLPPPAPFTETVNP